MKPASKYFFTLFIAAILVSISACASAIPSPIVEERSDDSDSPAPASTPTQPPTLTPTATPLSTDTPIPKPSNTPTPTNTVTPEPAEIETVIPLLTITPITDFELVAKVLEVPELGLTVQHPLFWFGAPNLEMGGILLADDFEAFTQGDANADAIGIFIVVVPDATGSANEITDFIAGRFENITEQIGTTTIEEIDGQEFAWAEYRSESDDGSELHYFISAVTNGMRGAAAFTSVYPDRQNEVRVIYRDIVERIEVHGTTQSDNN